VGEQARGKRRGLDEPGCNRFRGTLEPTLRAPPTLFRSVDRFGAVLARTGWSAGRIAAPLGPSSEGFTYGTIRARIRRGVVVPRIRDFEATLAGRRAGFFFALPTTGGGSEKFPTQHPAWPNFGRQSAVVPGGSAGRLLLQNRSRKPRPVQTPRIYGWDDRYRGIKGWPAGVFVQPGRLTELGLAEQQEPW